MTNNFPNLSGDFFGVIQTAIKSAAWKYEDFGRVRAVEAELENLRQFLSSQLATTTPEIMTSIGQADEKPQIVENDSSEVLAPRGEAPVASKPEDSKILSPDEVKKAPVRPMPDDILELVQGGIEVAKNPPKVRDVKVSELSSDPDAARNEFNKPF